MVNILAIQLVIFACFLPFWASEKQPLLAFRLPKLPAWLGFSALLGLAFALLLQYHNWLAAGLLILVNIMGMWILLVILSAYFSKKIFSVYIAYNVLFLAIALAGAVL